MKLFKHIFFYILTLVVSQAAYSQTNPEAKYRYDTLGTQFIDTIFSRVQPNVIVPIGLSMVGQPVSLTGNKWKCTFTNSSNQQKQFKIVYQYTEGQSIFNLKVRYTTTHLKYQASVAFAKADYVSVQAGETVTIKPLLNDVSSASTVSLTGVAQVQFGSATFAGDEITYTAPTNSANDAIVYSIVDNLGTKAVGRIVIAIEQTAFESTDTLTYTLVNTRTQQLILPVAGFVVSAPPSKGVVTQLSSSIYNYKPNTGVTGLDIFRFTDANGNSRSIRINLVALQENKSSVVNDVFYAARNQAVTFDVFANDLSDNFPISTFTPTLVHDTLGIFSYTPPVDFVGELNFTYTVNYGGGNTYQGKIKVVVGNLEPDDRFDYVFDTRKNEAAVLTYNIPLPNSHFNLLTEPTFGQVDIFESTNLEVGCNEVSAQSIITYTPDEGYYGLDEFDISYCISDSCYTYKITMNIHDTQDTTCRCVGSDCVYQGDLNGDGRVSVSDILSLGRYMGNTGAIRPSTSLPSWAGQASSDWGASQTNGRNTKHIDANGDGNLTKVDMASVDANYGDFNSLIPREILSVKDFPFYLVPNATELDSGDVLILDIMYGTTSKPAIDVFGIAFELNLPPALIDSASVTGYFEETGWFANHGATLQMVKQPQDGRIQAGFTKAGGIVDDEASGFKPAGSSGNGKIGQITMIVDDEASGFKSSSEEFITLPVTLENIESEDIDGQRYAIEGSTIELRYRRKIKDVPVPTSDKLMIYPNPARDFINIHFNGQNIIKGYKMTDVMGNIVTQNTSYDDQSSSIRTSGLPSGTYIIQVTSTAGVITKKIEIVND